MFYLLIFAAAEDVRFHKVSNGRIAAGLIIGLIFRVLEEPVWGIYYFLGSISFPVILLYLLFQMRVLGAGDIKLFSMIGSFLTIRELFRCMAYSFLAAAMGAVLFLAADKRRWIRLKCAVNYLFDLVCIRTIKPYLPPYEAGQSAFAFSVPILLGTAFAIIPGAVR